MTSMTRVAEQAGGSCGETTAHEGKNELSWVTWRQTPFRLAAADAGPLNMPLSGGAVQRMALSILINWQGIESILYHDDEGQLGTMVEPGAVIADDASSVSAGYPSGWRRCHCRWR
jgi:hypothetical protein